MYTINHGIWTLFLQITNWSIDVQQLLRDVDKGNTNISQNLKGAENVAKPLYSYERKQAQMMPCNDRNTQKGGENTRKVMNQTVSTV